MGIEYGKEFNYLLVSAYKLYSCEPAICETITSQYRSGHPEYSASQIILYRCSLFFRVRQTE